MGLSLLLCDSSQFWSRHALLRPFETSKRKRQWKNDEDDKRKKKIIPLRQSMSNNSLIAGIDLGDSTSLATILTATGDVADRFCFQMDDQGYSLFANRVPRDARLAFEATGMAYPECSRD